METEVTEISINGVDYIRKDAASTSPALSGDMQIVILQRGWVMVGHFSQDGEQCYLNDAKIIRIWGTTKGLGQLASDGPTSKTVLDPAGRVQFHEMTVVARIATDSKLWR